MQGSVDKYFVRVQVESVTALLGSGWLPSSGSASSTGVLILLYSTHHERTISLSVVYPRCAIHARHGFFFASTFSHAVVRKLFILNAGSSQTLFHSCVSLFLVLSAAVTDISATLSVCSDLNLSYVATFSDGQVRAVLSDRAVRTARLR